MRRSTETMFLPAALLAAFLLAGCAAVDTARDVVKVKGAEAADQALTGAEWVVCNAAPVGSVKRRYGQTMERADTYKDFCDGDGQANVIAPKE